MLLSPEVLMHNVIMSNARQKLREILHGFNLGVNDAAQSERGALVISFNLFAVSSPDKGCSREEAARLLITRLLGLGLSECFISKSEINQKALARVTDCPLARVLSKPLKLAEGLTIKPAESGNYKVEISWDLESF